MEELEIVECPFCFDRMQFEDRGGIGWMVCPNGCATEMEAPEPQVAAQEEAETLSTIRPRAAGAA
jgi:hypothetical protein